MTLPTAARAATRPARIAALSAAAIAIAATVAAAPARAATPPAPPRPPLALTIAIGFSGLTIRTFDGWQVVTGPAAAVNPIQDLAAGLGFGTIAQYTGDNETGTAVLILTGNDPGPVTFRVNGITADSADNDTSQDYYIDTDTGTLDAALTPGTAENITPADYEVGDQLGQIDVNALMNVNL